ncbi:hypothetical protein IQ07DRAFT_607202 [Pyrenochaeta sp. DS3sAY3a]|nr:hypothetical protein IQ07DRAFT_607202 [Pyrenochaeta sp. DS3sAY3a]
MDIPSSLARDISPPPRAKRRRGSCIPTSQASLEPADTIEPTLAAIEAGRAKIEDHLTYFRKHLQAAARLTSPGIPRLSISDFSSLYQSNQHEHGNHFVIHQHNHPKAGVHYDLRIQFSDASSISFAIPKGLPGDPNSKSIGRLAIETRVHCLWNHLIESASNKTGSLLIWDTGTYEVLPRKSNSTITPSPHTTDEDEDEEEGDTSRLDSASERQSHENEKLIFAFQTRYIRLRLYGTRLPKGYTIVLRLPSNELLRRPTARRKKSHQTARSRAQSQSSGRYLLDSDSDTTPTAPNNTQETHQQEEEDLNTDSEEDTQTRANNAYPGSTNSVGSIHQRHWFLQLDRQNSGFVLTPQSGKRKWVRGPSDGGFESFLVRGRDFERSVVTGRLAAEVESDEGVEGYVGRGGWVGVER